MSATYPPTTGASSRAALLTTCATCTRQAWRRLTACTSVLWRRTWPDHEVLAERWDLWAIHNH
ncbi:hypothetical protein [Deinococcus radiotolerans]|uniref:Uncharacterized protein n=1 Tax=Deinococcus radiotolerans TaxID=1309407 RepID=A0ABQ2FKZ5_9DEIO|nr:hypothetical protein [Deinococcus radiotolerans]GGL08354.1 hypothetical protein GCM10010844_28930 [Deinococcus radiotolerans]